MARKRVGNSGLPKNPAKAQYSDSHHRKSAEPYPAVPKSGCFVEDISIGRDAAPGAARHDQSSHGTL
jgi:hypothetical protein